MSTMPCPDQATPADGDLLALAPLHRSAAARYAVAIGLVVVAVALKSMLALIGQEQPFLLLYAAVILAAWSGGRGPGLTALVLAA